MTRLLVLGGTRHVGRAAVEHAVAQGWDVTTVNRGQGGPDDPSVTAVRADRTSPGALAAALAGLEPWDLVLDTWSGDPWVVQESSALLTARAAAYLYVSSVSVYQWPWPSGVDESCAVVEADPSGRGLEYAEAKRGAELAVLGAFGSERSVLARAGLILGPYEQVGRLPWWLRRLSGNGPVLVPGPPDRPLQFVDGRDLAGWLLAAAVTGRRGTVNAVGRPGMVTMGGLLAAIVAATGSRAEIQWLTPEQVVAAGLEPWTQLPIWTPPDGEFAAVHEIGVDRAAAWGLTTRPVDDTVADTWAWIQSAGYPAAALDGRVGLDASAEAAARLVLGLDD